MDEMLSQGSLKPIKVVAKVDGEERHELSQLGRTNADGEGHEQPLSPMARLFHEPGSNVYILSLLGTKTKIYPDVVKANLVHTILKHPRFTSLQVVDKESGGMKWVPTKVDLDDHVIVPDIKPTMDSPDKFVEDYISNMTETSTDKSKPMWDLHLLNLKTSVSEGVIILRVHHSVGDGLSLMSLLLACSRKISNPNALPTIPPTSKPPFMKMTGVKFVLSSVWNTLVGILLFMATVLFLKDSETPLKGRPGCEYNPRRIIKRTVNMSDIKLVKNAMKTTINDVVLGVTQAGLSRYLNRRYGEITEKNKNIDEKKNYLPKNIRLRSTFFINLRQSGGIQALDDMMEKGSPARWGNKIGYVLLPFTIAICKDPLEYVRRAKVEIDKKKTSLEPIYSYIFLKLLVKFFGIKAAGILNHKVFSNTTLWFSNVPGPQEEVAFCGHEVVYGAPTCYGQPNALMIHVVSYMDKLTFVISADEETLHDPTQLCDDLEGSLELIKAAVIKKFHVKAA